MFNGRPGPPRQCRSDQGTMAIREVRLVAEQRDASGPGDVAVNAQAMAQPAKGAERALVRVGDAGRGQGE